MEYAMIRSTLAIMMQTPSTQAEIADEALCGMTVECLDRSGEWVKIRTHYHYEGWVQEKHLCTSQELAAWWISAPKKVVLQSYADILSAPKVQGFLIGEATRGALLSPMGEPENGWQKVRFCDGREGWTWGDFLGEYKTSWNREDEPALREALTQTARTYLGTQYRWGGKSPLGIDCSGLCSMAYMLNGILIYRDANILPEFALHEIDRSEMKEGDLLFFPGHVAMYLGRNRYIHSTAGNNCHGVVINSLDPAEPDYRADLPAKITAIGSIF